jgi:hypothetical protein
MTSVRVALFGNRTSCACVAPLRHVAPLASFPFPSHPVRGLSTPLACRPLLTLSENVHTRLCVTLNLCLAACAPVRPCVLLTAVYPSVLRRLAALLHPLQAVCSELVPRASSAPYLPYTLNAPLSTHPQVHPFTVTPLSLPNSQFLLAPSPLAFVIRQAAARLAHKLSALMCDYFAWATPSVTAARPLPLTALTPPDTCNN